MNGLGTLALQGLQRGKLLIPEAVLEESCRNLQLTQEQLLSSGLLKLTGERVKEFYFVHLTFQEYLIALFVSQTPVEEQRRFVM